MAMSKAEAFETLQLPQGATTDDIVLNFKKLALEYHPDKHSQTEESFQNFRKICDAFQKLTKKDEKQRKKPLTIKRMFQLFEEVFFGEAASNQNGYPYFNPDSGDEDDYDDSDDDYGGATANKSHANNEYIVYNLDNDLPLASQEANKNADSLVAEEEKEKRKVVKRKAKKKKRKEKKKLEKESSQSEKQNNVEENGVNYKSDSDEDSKSEEELDPSSAFAMAVSRNKATNLTRNSKPEKFFSKDTKENTSNNNENLPDDDNPVILRSRNLAIRGNEMASVHKFQDAVELFSEAIKLNPKDFRFYGNRSFCYDKLNQFDKALKDAEKAIQLNSAWPKNYFRKGRALAGMKRYTEAEASFEQVLKLDSTCEDAEQELIDVRINHVMELGFSRPCALKSVKQHKSIQAAVDSLLNGSVGSDFASESLNEVYLSDDDGDPTPVTCPIKIPSPPNRDVKMDPSNPEGLASLWIGNVSKDVKERTLKQLFSNYGTVTSLRLIPDKFCAFVNFSDKISAGRAMKALQGVLCRGQRLLIRFPDKMGLSPPQNIIKKPPIKTNNTVVSFVNNNNNNQLKASGPVKDGECYFWRTTGCVYGDTCRYKHIKENKGIDWKLWHKS